MVARRKLSKRCPHCDREFVSDQARVFCSDICSRENATGEMILTPAEVDYELARLVRLETAPPWQRHPQGQQARRQ